MQGSVISDCLQKAVKEVIGMYLMKEPILKNTKVRKENTELKDISVVISLVSEKLEGVFIVSYNKKIIFEFMKNMLGEEANEINKDVINVSGEITTKSKIPRIRSVHPSV